MKYLINSICNFEIVTPFDINIKKNLLVTSLFKLSNNGYKNFSKYVNGLTYLNKIANEENLYLRIFIDKTIRDDTQLFEKIKQLNRAQIVMYTCSDLIINNHHIGLIGTLLRFFPLFDFENNDANFAIICDADTHEYKPNSFGKQTFPRLIELYRKMCSLNYVTDIYISYVGYYEINWTNKITHNGHTHNLPYCMGGSFIGFKKIPAVTLVKYFDKLKRYIKNPPDKRYTDYVIPPSKYSIKCENNICYGVDEYYLNKKLLKYFVINNMPFCYKYKYSIYEMLYSAHQKYGGYNDNPSKHEKTFRYYIQSNNLKQYLTFKSRKLYDIKQKDNNFSTATKDMIKLKNNIVAFLKLLYKKQDFRIYSKYALLQFFDIDYDKYYSIEQIFFVNSNMLPIILNAITCT